MLIMAVNSGISRLSPSLNLTKSLPTRTTSLSILQNFSSETTPLMLRWSPQKSQFRLSSSQNQTATVASPQTEDIAAGDSASDIVRKFYAGINRRDLTSVEVLISQNCVYEDLIFARPFVGRKDILEFFENFMDIVDKDLLQFVIDKISTEDSSAVGVTWHLEWKGKPFPFSKGCSFYQFEVVNGQRQIIYARDSVEPAIKPGKAALVLIRGVTWLLQQFPQLADRI